MKNILLTTATILTLSSQLFANQAQPSTSTGSSGLFFGISHGIGSGSFGRTIDNEVLGNGYLTEHISIDYENDDIRTKDTKFQLGKDAYYAFIQSGTIEFEDEAELDYKAFGVGFLFPLSQPHSGGLNVIPEFGFEIGYDTANYSYEQHEHDEDGIFLSFDLGITAYSSSAQNLAFTLGVSYDLHALTDDLGTEGTWNYGVLGLNFGTRLRF